MLALSARNEALIAGVLDAHLEAVATPDLELLRGAFTPNSYFVGTDNDELWSFSQFSAILYAEKEGVGRTTCTERMIYGGGGKLSECVATFFEIVVHEKYGPLRGSGTLIKNEDGNWKIAQYVWSFSIPNHVVDDESKGLLGLLAT